MAASDPRVVVMKFGGTSVLTAESRAAVARTVQAGIESGVAPVVVVSAMGRAGDPYATDTLLSLVNSAVIEPRERDLLMSTGEVISAVVVASELRAAGIAARAYTGAEAGIGTDGVFGSATVTDVHPGPLRAAVAAGIVPVVTGFQGVGADGSLTTLGRGGSDTTACALGVALGAEAVEIYTDVVGVMSADPRACEGPAVLEVVRADELHQMARHGARVVHTPAAELALTSGLAVRVRNTYTTHPGTLVADISSYRPDRVATAVTHADDVARICVSLPAPEGTRAHTADQARVYRAMADACVSLDMFTPVGETLAFSVATDALTRATEVLSSLGLTYRVQPSLSKVTLVGAGMHGVPGVMARMSEYLDRAGITVLQTADSHTTISVLVPAKECSHAVQALHDGFELGDPPS